MRKVKKIAKTKKAKLKMVKSSRQRLRALPRAAMHYRALVETLDVGYAVTDIEGKVLAANPEYVRLSGHGHLSEIIGRPVFEWTANHHKDKKTQAFAVCLKNGCMKKIAVDYADKDGVITPVEISATRVDKKKTAPVIMLCRDVSERRKADELIKVTLRAKTAFTSTVSHELRTPLSVLKESIALLSEGMLGAVNADQKKFLEISKRNIDRLTSLVEKVLDFQALECGKMVFSMTEGDINETIAGVAKNISAAVKAKGLELVIDLPEGLPRIKFDRDKIAQVLTNLISNSIKFTDKGSITVSAIHRNGAVRVSVKDTGCGVRDEDAPWLFHQYEQLRRKTGGTGLGLAISLEIIKAHGGRIWAEPSCGRGATMHFELPVHDSGDKK